MSFDRAGGLGDVLVVVRGRCRWKVEVEGSKLKIFRLNFTFTFKPEHGPSAGAKVDDRGVMEAVEQHNNHLKHQIFCWSS